MDQNFRKHISASFRAEPSSILVDKVIRRIHASKVRRLRIKMALSSVFSVLAIVALIPAASYLVSAFGQSDFASYMSLAFSDSAYFFRYFSDIILAAVSSWPLLETIALLSAIWAGIYSLRHFLVHLSALRTMKPIFMNQPSAC